MDINTILTWIKTKEMAVPEIQRPFVWTKKQVRDLMDSLYHAYPIGYLIAWKNPAIKLKDGTTSEGKKILIDGQQRITALTAAVLGKEVVDKNYKKEKITIAFHPSGSDEYKFEVLNPVIDKDASWISDISPIVSGRSRIRKVLQEYCKNNPDADEDEVDDNLEKLRSVGTLNVGIIELEHDLDIETVEIIFERVNSTGVTLSQADFVMSKIAAQNDVGSNLRKLIDYFCHLIKTPDFYSDLENIDKDFAKTGFLQKIQWLEKENNNLYEPRYSDLLRVAFTSEFNRGKMSDLVSLLSGRNFETREFESIIQENTFKKLEKSVLKFVNETNFKRFILIVKSAGFTNSKFIQPQHAINFAYIVYLKLKEQGMVPSEIEQFVKKWLVMSLLTGRYSSSPESTFDSDVKKITQDIKSHLKFIEDTDLSKAFWSVELLSKLKNSNRGSSFLSVFFASQIKYNDKGFLSKDITIRDMVDGKGDIHHIFPKAYLKKKFNNRGDYNQISNLVYTQPEINIAINDEPPFKYFEDVLKQCNDGEIKYGGIINSEDLNENMKQNCIPKSVFDMSIDDYHDFLDQRRELMAKKIENYYKCL